VGEIRPRPQDLLIGEQRRDGDELSLRRGVPVQRREDVAEHPIPVLLAHRHTPCPSITRGHAGCSLTVSSLPSLPSVPFLPAPGPVLCDQLRLSRTASRGRAPQARGGAREKPASPRPLVVIDAISGGDHRVVGPVPSGALRHGRLDGPHIFILPPHPRPIGEDDLDLPPAAAA